MLACHRDRTPDSSVQPGFVRKRAACTRSGFIVETANESTCFAAEPWRRILPRLSLEMRRLFKKNGELQQFFQTRCGGLCYPIGQTNSRDYGSGWSFVPDCGTLRPSPAVGVH